jgi:hypothetical protein
MYEEDVYEQDVGRMLVINEGRVDIAIEDVLLALEAFAIPERSYVRYTSFLNSMKKQLASGRDLSPGQEKYVSDIESKCCKQSIDDAKKWIDEYNDDLREIAVICAEYYALLPEGYFSNIYHKVLGDPKSHVLSKNEFTKMCMNKYATKVIQEQQSECRFNVGDMVEIRKTNRIDIAPNRNTAHAYKLFRAAMRGERTLALVMETKARPMNRAIAGGKIYKILPTTTGLPVYAAEKDLKRTKKVK